LRYFYLKQAESPDIVFLVDLDSDGSVLGFITGSPCSNQAFGRIVRSNLLGLGLRVPLRVIFSKASFQKGLRMASGFFQHGLKKKKTAPAPAPAPAKETLTPQSHDNNWGHLIGIAVTPSARGKGTAGELMMALEQELFKYSNVAYIITGTHADNAPANRLFQKRGYRLVSQREDDAGVVINHYRWDPPV
jgi:ribosomal protein S18 acetylase RimI-like enzyme